VESNFGGSFSEASSANIEAILSDNSTMVATSSATAYYTNIQKPTKRENLVRNFEDERTKRSCESFSI
jgi:hypothetical protein